MEWVHGLFLFPLVLGKMYLSHAKLGTSVFLCSLDNLLQKNVIVLFLEIKFQNGAHLKNGLLLTYFTHFPVTREKLQKFLQHISHSHTVRILLTLLTTNFEKNTNLSGTVMSPGVDSYSHHFGKNRSITKW